MSSPVTDNPLESLKLELTADSAPQQSASTGSSEPVSEEHSARLALDLEASPDLTSAALALAPLEPQAVTRDEEQPLAASVVMDWNRLAAVIGLEDGDPEFVEVFLEEAHGELTTIQEQLALWRTDLSDQQALATMRRSFHTLKGSGRMVGATAIGDFAWEFEALLNEVLSGTLPASAEMATAVAAAVDALAPLVGAAPLRDDALAVLPPLAARAQALRAIEPETVPPSMLGLEIGAGLDAEFIDVFLEEARGDLAAIREQQAAWRRNLNDRQALAILRRAFHTLKGSGRVVGATAIGGLAEQFEKMIGVLVNGERTATVAVADLVGEAAAVLEPLISKNPRMDEAAVTSLQRLMARAEAWLLETPEKAVPALVAVAPSTAVLAETTAAVPERGPSAALLIPPGVEPELAQIFQYEAAEILDASDMILQQLGIDPRQPGLWNDLRRSLHTLKGSSRLTGFMTVGDLAHAAESVLDALSKRGGDAAPGVLEALQQTLDRLNHMLAEAAHGVNPSPAAALIADLHQLAAVIAASGVVAGLADQPIVLPEETAVVPEPGALRPMTELDQELSQVFQTEAADVLDSSDLILRRLRGEPDNVELLNNLRREMHTLKGGSRMAGFMAVGDLAHATESALDALGKGIMALSAPLLDTLQNALDGLHQMVAAVVRGERPVAPPGLIDALQVVVGVEMAQPPAAAPTIAPRPSAPARLDKSAVGAPGDGVRVSAALLTNLVNQMGESSIFRARIDQGASAMSFNLNELDQTIARLRRQVSNLATQAEARIQSRHDHGVKAHQLDFDPLELDRFTELQQVARSLMEIADDLGNVGNTLGDHSREIGVLLDQQGKVNKEIQQGLMRTGMVRFGGVIPRLRRVVRQAAQELGKRAELLVSGEESEVDRTVLDNMVAPLEHMLRNSLAHGIEAPERRRAVGKSEIGTIALSLRREGAELVLELSDDGAGLNFEAIRAKGEEKGLLSPDQPATPEELTALLLRPGFSTATTVTQISGRGVGMDVVNEAIRALRGALLIQTEAGQGTRFIIRLPFSLSVTQALLARAGDSLFAIPLLSIERVTRLPEQEFQAYLAGESAQHQYNNYSYPIHNLGILVGSEQLVPFDEVADRHPPALLFRSAESSAALQVEAVLGNQEIIVKPVGSQFHGVPGISGATVLGDGQVVVVLELAALVRHVGSQTQKQAENRALRAARQEARPEKLSIMVIDDSITMRKVTARILERHNLRVITAKDGLDAVAMLQTEVPDLAILDIEMPRMDGFEVLAHVRNQPTLSHLPVIMVTSRGGDKHRERAIRLGVNDYLTKPYQEEQLVEAIRRIFGERALELMI